MNSFGLMFALLLAVSAHAQFLPENDLYKQDNINARDPNMTEEQFNALTDEVMSVYIPIAKKYQADLTAKKMWTNPTVNASANQSGKSWVVNMYGGLARRKEVTRDGYTMVVCHELGHHFAGFPMYKGKWAADEGQADYFATETCAKVMWSKDLEENAKYRKTVGATEKKACDKVYADPAQQDLCYRTTAAGRSLASLLAALNSKGPPSFDTPDPKVVTTTFDAHPAAQCRLDTYFHGALCRNQIDSEKSIPGKNNPAGPQSLEAEKEASDSSCFTYAQGGVDSRPLCWFKPRIGL